FRDYIITNYRIIDQHGILSKDANIILANRISDISIDRTFADRMLGLGRIVLRMEEVNKPEIRLIGIRDVESFQNDILKLISKDNKS
ncbi:PH domain-containing protein, partial [Candidatus Parvarchaeota archaeon]|nr:PH domain-containing protein [Candidatus Acidifodinimicrobium mancum]